MVETKQNAVLVEILESNGAQRFTYTPNDENDSGEILLTGWQKNNDHTIGMTGTLEFMKYENSFLWFFLPNE